MRKKLILLWSVYALMVAGLAYEALLGIGREGGIFSVLLLLVAPALAILPFFRQMSRLILSGVDKWRSIVREGLPLGKFRDTGLYQNGVNMYDRSHRAYFIVGPGSYDMK